MLENKIQERINGSLESTRACVSSPAGLESQLSKLRYRQAALASTASAINKAIVLLTSLVSVPLTVKYLDAETYGLWLALSSVVPILSFADLGLGNGLLNAVAASSGRSDHRGMTEAISSSFFSLALLGGAIAVFAAPVLLHIPLAFLTGAKEPRAIAELLPSAAILIGCLSLNLPLDVVQRTQAGLQRTFITNIWRCGGSTLAAVLLVAAIRRRMGLPGLVLATFGGPLLVVMLNFVVFFGFERSDLRPRTRTFKIGTAFDMASLGFRFVVCQAGAAILSAAPIFATAHVIGAAEAGIVGVTQRLFLIPYTLCEFVWSPLWPAYGEAFARGDIKWIRNTVRGSSILCMTLMALMVTCLVPFATYIVGAWTHGEIKVTTGLAAAVGGLMLARVFRGCLSAPLNGCGVLRWSSILFACSGVLCVAATAVLKGGSAIEFMLAISVMELSIVAGMSRDISRLLTP